MAKKTAKRSLYVMEEATFGVDPSATGSGYSYLHANSDVPSWAYEIVESAVQNDRLAPTLPEVGRPSGGFTFRMPMRGSGLNTGVGAVPASDADIVLKHLLGAVTRGTGTTTSGVPTTTSIPVTSAAGLMKGAVIFINVAGVPYPRVITNIVGSTLTIAPALPSAPASGQTVYAAGFFTHADVNPKSLAFCMVIEDVPVTFLGCKCTGRITGFQAGGEAMLEVEVEADSWVVGGKASLPAANDLIASRVPVVKGAPIWYGAGAALASKLAAGLELDFGIESQWIESTEAATTRSGFEITKRALEAQVEAWYDAAFATDLAAGSALMLAAAVGTPTNGWGFCITKGMVKGLEGQDRNGMLGQRLTVGAYDTDSADAEFILSVF